MDSMNISLNNLSNYSTIFTQSNFQPILTDELKKVLAVAAIAFASLAAIVYIGVFCFKAKEPKGVMNLKPIFKPDVQTHKTPISKSPSEEFKDKRIELKKQFDQAKTISEKLNICEEFSVVIHKFRRFCFTANNRSENEALLLASEELIMKMVIEIDKMDLSLQNLNLTEKENLAFNKTVVKVLEQTNEAIKAKDSTAAQAKVNRAKFQQRFLLKNPSDTTFETDRKKNAQALIKFEEDFQSIFKNLLDVLNAEYNSLIENSELSYCSDNIYKILEKKLSTLSTANLEPGIDYTPL